MTDQTIDLPEGGNERVETSDDNYADLTSYFEPGDEPDDQDTDAAATDDGVGDEAGLSDEDGKDADADQPEAPDPEAPQEPVYAEHDAKVRLADGRETTVADLISGGMMKQDHTRKTQEVAEMRRGVEADAQRIEGITQAFIEHLSTLIPDEPPHSLALSDPQAFVRAKAQHDAALAQVQKLVEIGGQPKQITQAMSEADQRALLAEENRKLVEAFPETATQEGRKRFWDDVSETAMEIGFSAEELSQVSDHRLFKLAHWARRGMAADKAKAEAKAKAAKAPPVAPQKPGQGVRNAGRNVEAMRKLGRTGSIQDAMAVDFE